MKSLKRFWPGGAKHVTAAEPEAPLWDHLDACGIPFRTPMQELITRHGSFPTPSDSQTETCVFGGIKPFVDGEGQPASFTFNTQTDLSKAPQQLFCAVSASQDYRLNYAKAIHALVKLFGEGEVDSHDDRTGRVWQFGNARLSCTVYPPEKNAWRDTPHLRPEAERVMAAISITPAWRTL